MDDKVTILIPTSPIPSHPDTTIIENTIKSVRFYFPSAKIIVMADGVRPEVEHRRGQYEQYLKNLSFKAFKWGNLDIIRFPFSQQAIMTRETVQNSMKTPYVLFVEHDCYLTQNPPMEWKTIIDLLDSKAVNMVRMYHWDRIWHEHEYLMREHFTFDDVEFVKTVQYSQWPNIATREYYLHLLTTYFLPNKRAMIEPVVYGPVANAPWEENKIVIYYPPNANTFIHANGRVDSQGFKDQNTEIY